MTLDGSLRSGVDDGGDDTVVAAIDPAGESADEKRFVIADVSTDDAWLSMAAEAAPTLRNWR